MKKTKDKKKRQKKREMNRAIMEKGRFSEALAHWGLGYSSEIRAISSSHDTLRTPITTLSFCFFLFSFFFLLFSFFCPKAPANFVQCTGTYKGTYTGNECEVPWVVLECTNHEAFGTPRSADVNDKRYNRLLQRPKPEKKLETRLETRDQKRKQRPVIRQKVPSLMRHIK